MLVPDKHRDGAGDTSPAAKHSISCQSYHAQNPNTSVKSWVNDLPSSKLAAFFGGIWQLLVRNMKLQLIPSICVVGRSYVNGSDEKECF